MRLLEITTTLSLELYCTFTGDPVTWLGWQCEAGAPRRRSSCCGRCYSCRLFGRSIWDWSLSSLDSRSGLPVKVAHGAAAGSETSSPGGPPRTSGQTGEGSRDGWEIDERRGRGGGEMDGWTDDGTDVPTDGAEVKTAALPESLEGFHLKMSSAAGWEGTQGSIFV